VRIRRPSARWIYALARLVDGPALVDIGCRPRSAILGLMDHGVCAEGRWPFEAAEINAPPPFDVVRSAGDALVSGHYRIAAGDDVIALMREAIARGFVPMIGTPIDDSFGAYSGGVWGGTTGPERGRHALAVLGYRPGSFLAVNSWGHGWGAGGLCWISEEWIASSRVTDRIVVTAVPGGSLR
jgi:hypothetical protein